MSPSPIHASFSMFIWPREVCVVEGRRREVRSARFGWNKSDESVTGSSSGGRSRRGVSGRDRGAGSVRSRGNGRRSASRTPIISSVPPATHEPARIAAMHGRYRVARAQEKSKKLQPPLARREAYPKKIERQDGGWARASGALDAYSPPRKRLGTSSPTGCRGTGACPA